VLPRVGDDGVRVDEPELLEDPEDPEEELPELEPWWCPPLWSGSMYCELPAELPPPPPASAVVLVARPSPITATAQTSTWVRRRMTRYSSSAGRLHAPPPENQAAKADQRARKPRWTRVPARRESFGAACCPEPETGEYVTEKPDPPDRSPEGVATPLWPRRWPPNCEGLLCGTSLIGVAVHSESEIDPECPVVD
jgi:hypothetical protein